jgi:hypothetical protein
VALLVGLLLKIRQLDRRRRYATQHSIPTREEA